MRLIRLQRTEAMIEIDEPSTVSNASLALRVFSTIELLEQVLLHLGAKNLVRLQRVCRQWKDLMARSETLQERLFLSPAPIRAFAPWKRAPPPPFARLANPTRVSTTSPNATPITTLHPALEDASADVYDTRIDFMIDAKKLLDCEPASWRRTFVTQPPTTSLLLYCVFEWDQPHIDTATCERRIQDENGVRLGTVLEYIRQELDGVSRESKDVLIVFNNPHAD